MQQKTTTTKTKNPIKAYTSRVEAIASNDPTLKTVPAFMVLTVGFPLLLVGAFIEYAFPLIAVAFDNLPDSAPTVAFWLAVAGVIVYAWRVGADVRDNPPAKNHHYY